MGDWLLLTKPLVFKTNHIFNCCQAQFCSSLLVSCLAAIKMNNFEFKLLHFCLKAFLDFVAVRGHVT